MMIWLMAALGMMIGAVTAMRVGVHDGRCQPRYGVHEPVFSLDSDGVRGQDCQVGRHGDVAFSTQAMSDPSQLDGADVDCDMEKSFEQMQNVAYGDVEHYQVGLKVGFRLEDA